MRLIYIFVRQKHLNAYHSQMETSNTEQQTGFKCKHVLNRNLLKFFIFSVEKNVNRFFIKSRPQESIRIELWGTKRFPHLLK